MPAKKLSQSNKRDCCSFESWLKPEIDMVTKIENPELELGTRVGWVLYEIKSKVTNLVVIPSFAEDKESTSAFALIAHLHVVVVEL